MQECWATGLGRRMRPLEPHGGRLKVPGRLGMGACALGAGTTTFYSMCLHRLRNQIKFGWSLSAGFVAGWSRSVNKVIPPDGSRVRAVLLNGDSDPTLTLSTC